MSVGAQLWLSDCSAFVVSLRHNSIQQTTEV